LSPDGETQEGSETSKDAELPGHQVANRPGSELSKVVAKRPGGKTGKVANLLLLLLNQQMNI